MTVALMLSGGPDSTILAHDLVAQGKEVLAITFNFSDPEETAEERFAAACAQRLGLEHIVTNFAEPLRTFYKKPKPQLLRKVIDLNHDVEPFGAGIALSLAASLTAKRGITDLYYGVHLGDSMYRDNNSRYFSALSEAISIDVGQPFMIHTPYLETAKSALLLKGSVLGVDYTQTWSCGARSDVHCGTCLPCTDRQEAFLMAGLGDPTPYVQPQRPELLTEQAQLEQAQALH